MELFIVLTIPNRMEYKFPNLYFKLFMFSEIITSDPNFSDILEYFVEVINVLINLLYI